MSNRHQRRASLREFKREARASLVTYMIEANDPLDRAPVLRDAVAYWRGNLPTRKPICICCKGPFTGDVRVEVAAFLLATISSASPRNASVSGICTACWNTLTDDQLEAAALRVLKAVLPNARFAP